MSLTEEVAIRSCIIVNEFLLNVGLALLNVIWYVDVYSNVVVLLFCVQWKTDYFGQY